MKAITLKVARIGNSRGVRLPAKTLAKYAIGGAVTMEERADGIFLRPSGPATAKLSWTATAQAMAGAGESWDAWGALDADGLESAPWPAAHEGRKVAEPAARYTARAHGKPTA